MATIAAARKTAITAESPILECELPLDGSRFEGLKLPAASAPVFATAKERAVSFTLADYVASGVMTARQKALIEEAIEERRTILIAGGAGSGKTTLVNAVIAHLATACADDRLVILEDTADIERCEARTR